MFVNTTSTINSPLSASECTSKPIRTLFWRCPSRKWTNPNPIRFKRHKVSRKVTHPHLAVSASGQIKPLPCDACPVPTGYTHTRRLGTPAGSRTCLQIEGRRQTDGWYGTHPCTTLDISTPHISTWGENGIWSVTYIKLKVVKMSKGKCRSLSMMCPNVHRKESACYRISFQEETKVAIRSSYCSVWVIDSSSASW